MGWYCKVYFQYHQKSFLRISSITLKFWTCNPHVLFRVSFCSLTTFPFCFHLFLRTFQQPNPVCCNRSTTNLFMISFLSRTIDFFFFFLSLWIYLWLAETSQQPISQTTWLKVDRKSTRHHKNKWPELCSSNVVFNFLLIAKMQQHDSFNLPRPSSL